MLRAAFQVKISQKNGNKHEGVPGSGFVVQMDVNICRKENLKPVSMSFTLPHA
jgi:hypothetical protein